jgi:hypothetical protein
MPGEVTGDVCGVAYQDVISPVEKVEQNTVHTGLQIIQQERLRSHTELVRCHIDVARVDCVYLPCNTIKSSWNTMTSRPARVRRRDSGDVFECCKRPRLIPSTTLCADQRCEPPYQSPPFGARVQISVPPSVKYVHRGQWKPRPQRRVSPCMYLACTLQWHLVSQIPLVRSGLVLKCS